MELPLVGRKYSWSNNHEDPTYALLDRVSLSPTWEDRYPLVQVSTLSRELSDHTPLYISSGEKPKIPYMFKFGNCWFQRADRDDVVRKVWGKRFMGWKTMDQMHGRLVEIKRVLKGWNWNIEVVYKKHKRNLIEDLII